MEDMHLREDHLKCYLIKSVLNGYIQDTWTTPVILAPCILLYVSTKFIAYSSLLYLYVGMPQGTLSCVGLQVWIFRIRRAIESIYNILLFHLVHGNCWPSLPFILDVKTHVLFVMDCYTIVTIRQYEIPFMSFFISTSYCIVDNYSFERPCPCSYMYEHLDVVTLLLLSL